MDTGQSEPVLEIVNLNRFSSSAALTALRSTGDTLTEDCEQLRRSYPTNPGTITNSFLLIFRKTENFGAPTIL